MESHFKFTYSSNYLVIYLPILCMSKTCQLHAVGIWLSKAGFLFLLIHCTWKYGQNYCCLSWIQVPVYFCICQSRKVLLLLLHHELRHVNILSVNCEMIKVRLSKSLTFFKNEQNRNKIALQCSGKQKVLHMCITLQMLHLPLCSTAVISLSHTQYTMVKALAKHITVSVW